MFWKIKAKKIAYLKKQIIISKMIVANKNIKKIKTMPH